MKKVQSQGLNTKKTATDKLEDELILDGQEFEIDEVDELEDELEDDSFDKDTDQDDTDSGKPKSTFRFNDPALITLVYDVITTQEVFTIRHLYRILSQQGVETSVYKLRRLLSALGIKKGIDHKGRSVYQADFTTRKQLAVKSNLYTLVIAVTHNQNMVFVKTVTAAAQLVSKVIDVYAKDLHILGTLAGDDAVLLIPRDVNEVELIVQKVYDLIHDRWV